MVHCEGVSDLRVKNNGILLYSSEKGFWVGTRVKNSLQPFDTIRYNNVKVEVSEQFIFFPFLK